MAAKTINIAVIGANIHMGWGGGVHLPALLKLPEYQVVAVCTSRKETAEEAAEHFNVPMAFHNYQDMIAHPDVEAVSVYFTYNQLDPNKQPGREESHGR